MTGSQKQEQILDRANSVTSKSKGKNERERKTYSMDRENYLKVMHGNCPLELQKYKKSLTETTIDHN